MSDDTCADVSADGVLAQLGARNIRNVEATGSNPVYSIRKANPNTVYQCSDFLLFARKDRAAQKRDCKVMLLTIGKPTI